MISGRVDQLKIDVEGMEMSVLKGAGEVIGRTRPLIFVEVTNRNTNALMAWVRGNDYRVARLFADNDHANHLFAPGAAS